MEGRNPLPFLACHTAFDTAQDVVGFLGYLCIFLAHIELPAHQHYESLLPRAALDPFLAQPVFVVQILPVLGRTLQLKLFSFMWFAQTCLSSCEGPSGCYPIPAAC